MKSQNIDIFSFLQSNELFLNILILIVLIFIIVTFLGYKYYNNPMRVLLREIDHISKNVMKYK